MREELPRDQYGRPLIDCDGKPRPYTRISTLAKALDKGEGLTKWKIRKTAEGLASRPDLLALVQSAKPDDTRTVDQACEQAMEAARSQEGANMGTALHSLTERVDDGELDQIHTSPEVMADLKAYAATMNTIKVLAKEIFVVVDEIEAAGTFDRLVQIGDQIYVADIKTGQNEPKFPHSAAMQTAIYAHGTTYTTNEGRISDLTKHVDQERALLIHLPAGQARCELYWLDIATGWEMALLATRARKWQSSKPIEVIV